MPGVTFRAWRVSGVTLRAWQVLEERIHSLETDADHKTGLQMQMEAERSDRHRLEEELAEAAAHIMHLRAQAPLPQLRCDWARLYHICTGTGLPQGSAWQSALTEEIRKADMLEMQLTESQRLLAATAREVDDAKVTGEQRC